MTVNKDKSVGVNFNPSRIEYLRFNVNNKSTSIQNMTKYLGNISLKFTVQNTNADL